MIKVERDKELPRASFASLELRAINEKTARGKGCNIRRDGKGILLRSFYVASCSSIDCTAASPSFAPSLPSFSLFAPPFHPLCDVLKGHVKYSGGIFITVLSGNARRLISLSARGRRAKWIANVFGCQCTPPFFLALQKEYCIIFIKFTHNTCIRSFQRYN